jgi:Flp pilus assembly pilin Flp
MIAYGLSFLECMKSDRKGVTALEYGVIAAAIVVAVAGAATVVAAKLPTLFATLGSLL